MEVLYSLQFNYTALIVFAAFLALSVMAGVYFGRLIKKPVVVKILVIAAVGILSVACLIGILATVFGNSQARNVYRSGQYREDFGEVEQYQPIYKEDGWHTPVLLYDEFSIDGVKFELGMVERVSGYNEPGEKGGLICQNGQTFRIRYYTDENGHNVILEIAKPTN